MTIIFLMSNEEKAEMNLNKCENASFWKKLKHLRIILKQVETTMLKITKMSFSWGVFLGRFKS